MEYLIQGMESRNKITLMMKLTKITSVDRQNAIIDHFVNGATLKNVAEAHSADASNIRASIKKLNEIAGIMEQLIESEIIERKLVKQPK